MNFTWGRWGPQGGRLFTGVAAPWPPLQPPLLFLCTSQRICLAPETLRTLEAFCEDLNVQIRNVVIFDNNLYAE